jgi:hypothetical protein
LLDEAAIEVSDRGRFFPFEDVTLTKINESINFNRLKRQNVSPAIKRQAHFDVDVGWLAGHDFLFEKKQPAKQLKQKLCIAGRVTRCVCETNSPKM